MGRRCSINCGNSLRLGEVKNERTGEIIRKRPVGVGGGVRDNRRKKRGGAGGQLSQSQHRATNSQD